MEIAKPLTGVRILDFSWVRAGPWATRWLAALGAQVVKVESPNAWRMANTGRGGEGQAALGVPPGTAAFNATGGFNDSNAGKLSVTLNMRSEQGLDLARKLVAISDVVIENFSSRVLKDWGLGYEVMRQIKPDVIYVSMAGLGHTGRNSVYETAGPIVQALTGLTYVSGLPGKPPAGWGWSYMDDTGGMYGVMSVLTALHHRAITGEGQHIDLAQVAAGMTLTGPALLDLTVNKRPMERAGYPPGNRTVWPGTPLVNNYRGPTVVPHNAYRTAPREADGYNDWCAIACFSDEEWRRLCAVMGSPDWANDQRFATLLGRIEHQEELDRDIEAWTKTVEKYELADRCQRAGVRAMPVQSSEDRVEHDPQLRAQGMYRPAPHPVLGNPLMQNFPFTLSAADVPVERGAPLFGEHNAEVLSGLLGLTTDQIAAGYENGTFWSQDLPREAYLTPIKEVPAFSMIGEPRPTSAAPTRRFSDGALSDLRVLELSDERGEWCGKLLADHGADVIKIEPPGGSDERQIGPFYRDEPHPERSLHFWHYNTSKRAVTLDIETEDGRALFRELVKTADVVLETFRPGYLPSLGLGYDELRRDNPRLIMCSLTDFGQTGPWRDYVASDLLHLAAGGQMASCGYNEEDVPDAPPIAPGGGNAWHMGGHYAYIAIGAAVCMRDLTGVGQCIDVSVHGACALTTEGAISNWIYSRQVVRRNTGRHASIRPSAPTQFLCADGKYINSGGRRGIPQTPERLRVYAEWMDKYGMADDLLDEKYMDAAVLKESQEHIIDVTWKFISQLTAEEAYHGLQQLEFPTGAVRTPADCLNDPHWHDRGFFVDVAHPEIGEQFTYPGAASLYSATPWRIWRRAPLIGEHNCEVYGELGLDRARLSVLREVGAI